MSIGAVAMVSQVENLISLGGTSKFLVVGVAGGIGADVGLSDHYLRPGECVEADIELSGLLHDACSTRASTTRR